MSPQFGDYQHEIYFDGLRGVVPGLPMTFAELEARAEAMLPPSIWSYVAGGAGDEYTQRANVAAFQHWGLIPRMLVGAARRELSVELFGLKLPSPLFMSPVGVIGLCAQDGHGDLATARAAARTGVPMIASTLSVDPMEAVAQEFGETPASSSSTPPRIGSWPKTWSIAPRPPASKASSSPSTPGSPAGVPVT
ncbi:alpha-hydroxy-acid oxidizing protein [Streptosporangium lutulentum]